MLQEFILILYFFAGLMSAFIVAKKVDEIEWPYIFILCLFAWPILLPIINK